LNLNYLLFQYINNLAGHYLWLDTVGIFFASYFQYVICLSLFLLLFIIKKPEKTRALIYIALAFLAAVIARYNFAAAIHWFWPIPRPFVSHRVAQLVIPDTWSSFPSGHATFFFALSAVIYFYARKVYPRQSRWIALWFFGGSLLIGLGRIYSGIHYPADVLAGLILGSLTGWLVFWLAGKAKLIN